MPTPILATKLYRAPLRPGVVRRERLIARLSAGLHRRLTLVSAPPGFGKTTLISDWLAAGERPVAWLSLDERDQDPTRFLVYLVAALQSIAPTLGAAASGLLQSPQPPPAELVLITLLNDISAWLTPFVLVLDDYHLVDAAAVDQALGFLLEHLPAQMHMVIATREDPRLPLARLRARDQLTEIRIADLRFSTSEAAEFLNHSMGLVLSDANIAALEARTEGWIAGLQLAAISAQGHSDATGFIASFTGSHRFIMDYLVEEVLQQQSEDVKQFLLQTAILSRLSASLCEAVTGTTSPAGSRILAYLDQANLLLVRLDDQRHWFRYHHLFADMLHARLLQEMPEQVPGLHLRASEWFAQQGFALDAIRHALAAGAPVRVAELLERAWPELDGSFQTHAWLGWAEKLPEEILRGRPVLGTCHGWALLNDGRLEAGAARLALAEADLNNPDRIVIDQAQFHALPATIATARAFHAQAIGDTPATLHYARVALGYVPATDFIKRGVVTAIMALAHWALGELEPAYQALDESMAGFRQAGQIHFALSGTFGLADIRKAQGRLQDAVTIYRQALKLADAHQDTVRQGVSDLYLGMAELSRERGELADAGDLLQRSEQLGEAAGLPDWRYRFCLAQARLMACRREYAEALVLLDQAEAIYTRTPVPDLRPVGAIKARVWLRQGERARAEGWVSKRGLSPADELSYLAEFEHLTLARVLLAQQNEPLLAELLVRLLHCAEAGGRTDSVIEILVLQALAHQQQGKSAPALDALVQALQLAEPEAYVQVFIDEGPPMARLLSQAVAQGRMPVYASRLLVALAKDAADAPEAPYSPVSPVTHQVPVVSSLVEPLSQRELEVLGLIAQGLSNDQMCERLFLALSTVKGHNRNIFGKLGVKRRTEAVARARELGLLPTGL
ncbi:MAG: helix-turn-helix transcriptional regulator [Candidatus Melainabacteria bacterium HGW-Melainabacteria-1]|nr:MAG: helix-turn-helix transcriptional regulator [Candidatus Melainabacteria bacterium HGW-Melainabacteria-1]